MSKTRKSRIVIKDLPTGQKLSKEEIKRVRGGLLRSATQLNTFKISTGAYKVETGLRSNILRSYGIIMP
ncbi:MAG: hypothetical protein HZB61_12905 [Nitrospirae bacterium]|nr:hypothetical protein [Nitrospirota bacterium]